jgi:hypothetical protein
MDFIDQKRIGFNYRPTGGKKPTAFSVASGSFEHRSF